MQWETFYHVFKVAALGNSTEGEGGGTLPGKGDTVI